MKEHFKNIEKLSQKNAEDIANNWHYEGNYSFYDMKNDIEDYEEIISPKLRKSNYFQILDDENNLTAFFCIESNGSKRIEVGLGMKPSLTGQGHGQELMKLIEKFIQKNTDFKEIILSVASFNKRALKLYQNVVFKMISKQMQSSNGGKYEFIILNKKVQKCPKL